MRDLSLRLAAQLAVALGGVAALSWEVIWQTRASLSIGISAVGTALTLAATMGGMMVGAWAMGRALRSRGEVRPLRLYAGLEAVIGLSGLLLAPGFTAIEHLDVLVFAWSPAASPVAQGIFIAALLSVPTVCMGATVPVFELMGRVTGTSVARLYGINTAGAAAGVLGLTFLVVPSLGLLASSVAIAAVNGLVCIAMLAFDRLAAAARGSASARAATPVSDRLAPEASSLGLWIVFGTGFVTFALEVTWFRALRAAFQSTTEVFAIILAAVLVPLAIGARLVPWLRARGITPRSMLGVAAVAVLLATPLIERADLTGWASGPYGSMLAIWAGLSFLVLGPPIFFLGLALPWYLEEAGDPQRAGRLYAVNTLGAVIGSLSAAWILLPSLGFARAAWGLGVVTALLALAAPGHRYRVPIAACTAVALAVAVNFTSSLGRARVQSTHDLSGYRIIAFDEGADSTIAVVEAPDGVRKLLIDGFGASAELLADSAYMEWMGHLPMMLHPDPQRALVICFGTGLTANAVRDEGPRTLDVVDVDRTVFEMAPYFRTNDGVLQDERVRRIVMDGRAWLRRSREQYDVITLEPMPPYFAAVNALYSLEFYEFMAERLAPGGIAAQWLPIHLVPPFYAESVVATFHAVFPDSLLWLDPYTQTGVIVGRRAGSPTPLGSEWPGIGREVDRGIADEAIQDAVTLTPAGLLLYSARGALITDDNQLLAYGRLRTALVHGGAATVRQKNLETIRMVGSIQLGRNETRSLPPP